ncbi:hypothetical protein C8Q76DRAFT_803960 [Earliella scabrosa]|nr:hypothetical protein C8Q76DRAFT_803960 [Earliella scabrosa]
MRETGTSRVERPVPSAEKESAATASASRILKAAGKMRAPSESGNKRVENGKEGQNADADEVGERGEVHAHAHAEPRTDPDGWVYADNKWEGGSSKGGLGKYTRYRRWTHVAVLTETVEIVRPGELSIQRDELMLLAMDVHHPEPSPPPPALPAPPAVSIQNAQAESVNDTTAHETQSPTRSSISLEEEGSMLRQRLKAAMMSATGHS